MKILIIGSTKAGNIGDDLLAVVTAEIVKAAYPKAEVKIENSSRKDLVNWADVVILGPGGLIDDIVEGNVENYLDFLELAQNQQKLNLAVGIAVQRLETDGAKISCRKILSRADFVSVRSQQDAVILKEAGVTSQVYALQDIAFILGNNNFLGRLVASLEQDNTLRRFPKMPTVRKRPKLGFSLMNWELDERIDRNKIRPNLTEVTKQYTDYIHKNFSKLTSYFDLTLICQSSDDYPLYKKLADDHGASLLELHKHPLEQAIKLHSAYKNVDVVLTGRFHGLIMAMLTGKPTMNVSISDHKQAKLSQDAPSLKRMNYGLEQLYQEDLFDKFISMHKHKSLPIVEAADVERCRRLASFNISFLEYHLLRHSS